MYLCVVNTKKKVIYLRFKVLIQSMTMFKILQNFKNYEFICKRRNHHKPNSEDEVDFLKNPKFRKETYCEDCGFGLELRLDEEDIESYWIQEL